MNHGTIPDEIIKVAEIESHPLYGSSSEGRYQRRRKAYWTHARQMKKRWSSPSRMWKMKTGRDEPRSQAWKSRHLSETRRNSQKRFLVASLPVSSGSMCSLFIRRRQHRRAETTHWHEQNKHITAVFWQWQLAVVPFSSFGRALSMKKTMLIYTKQYYPHATSH